MLVPAFKGNSTFLTWNTWSPLKCNDYWKTAVKKLLGWKSQLKAYKVFQTLQQTSK